MPLRGDFDVEHDNDAEHLLADMEMEPDDDPSERELKFMVMEVFNRSDGWAGCSGCLGLLLHPLPSSVLDGLGVVVVVGGGGGGGHGVCVRWLW
jgi:hypothetical protein